MLIQTTVKAVQRRGPPKVLYSTLKAFQIPDVATISVFATTNHNKGKIQRKRKKEKR